LYRDRFADVDIPARLGLEFADEDLPARQAAVARGRVLNTRTLQSHLSSRGSSIPLGKFITTKRQERSERRMQTDGTEEVNH